MNVPQYIFKLLSKHRILRYEKNELDTFVQCSESVAFLNLNSFDIQNKKDFHFFTSNDQKLFLGRRLLKKIF